MSPVPELAPADLRRVCDVSHLPFETTAELPYTKKIIGQPRGTHSIEFGIDIASPGFNIFVMGPSGTGRTTTIERFLQEKAAAGPVPNDWVYVQNFQDPRRPRAISLAPGQGARFRDDLIELVAALTREIPQAFETEEYKDALASIVQELEAKRNLILQKIRQEAAEQGFAIVRTPDGLVVTPVVDGQPMSVDVYQSLEPEKREELDQNRRTLERGLEDALQAVQEVEREARDEMTNLGRRVGASVVGRFLEPLNARYADNEETLLHLSLVREDVVQHVGDFLSDEDSQSESPPKAGGDWLGRYSVNLVVDHGQTAGAPVVVESNPTYHNLVGRIEYDIQYGSPTTNFTNIKVGALHRANGGYLVLRAGDLLSKPHAWPALKRALNDREIRIEEPAAESVATKTLDPEPIPLHVKIILMGSSALYYTLLEMEQDFAKLFKVQADFDAEMDRTTENEHEYALFVAARCHEEKLRHFDRGAVAKVIEQGSRLAESQDKLITRFGEVADVVREASYWAGAAGREMVTEGDVTRAVEEQIYRRNLLEKRLRRQIQEGVLLVDTTGTVMGQVNGLYVIQVGDYRFGQPSRITARTFMGSEGVVSIEREVKLAGPIHNRGVMTLIGYLGGTYAQGQPLSLSASLAFEQNYGGIEGDSASSAELYALLSSLSGFAIDQGLAVTGSVNQWGEVQPIGGVAQKIEGFYDVCSERGLTGDQGVIIPAANVRDLMLRQDVVEAVKAQRFHIWAVRTIDEGLELLTGVPAGERQADGGYAPDTVHGAVQKRLRQLAVELEAFGKDRGD
jgi:lon-related putative ATP-dependent protease